MSRIRFIKMEGCGNDYVFVDGGLASNATDLDSLGSAKEWIPRIVDRHRGVGGDGLILLLPGEKEAFRMQMWNADGSAGLLCLNGLRCAAKYVAEETETGDEFVVETASGDRRVRVFRNEEGKVHEVEVDAGTPDFRRKALPALGEGDELWAERFYVGGTDLLGYGVSVGNPHLVLWMDEEEALWRAPLAEIGEPLSEDPRFPKGVNVHLVTVRNGKGLVMRSWERGSGLTLACGSGAVGSFAVVRRLGEAPAEASVEMPGGSVRMAERGDGSLIMRGPAREVFRGNWAPSGGGTIEIRGRE
jgi:diaminopimelate epimerase